jgi:hypothetical protein
MGTSTSDLRTLSEGREEGEEGDFERVLRQRRLQPEICHPFAERTAAGAVEERTATRARSELQPRSSDTVNGGMGGRWLSLVGAAEGAVAPVDALDS